MTEKIARAADPAAVANALIAVTARLVELMEREIASLEAMRPREIEALQREKAALVHAYDEHLRGLAADPAQLASLAPVLRDELWRVARRFETVVKANEAALRAAAEANSRLIKAVAGAVQEQARDNGAYTRTAVVAPRPARGDARVLSLALDRTL